jgi:hypothetical protein
MTQVNLYFLSLEAIAISLLIMAHFSMSLRTGKRLLLWSVRVQAVAIGLWFARLCGLLL